MAHQSMRSRCPIEMYRDERRQASQRHTALGALNSLERTYSLAAKWLSDSERD